MGNPESTEVTQTPEAESPVLPARPRRLYWIESMKTRPNTLIFDPGYSGGDVHVYVHSETLPATAIRDDVLRELKVSQLDPLFEPEVVGMWARKRGANVEWPVGP